MTKLIVNVETGEMVERELNAEELAQQAIDEAASAERIAAATAKAAEKEALLARLGITADEAKLLLA